MRATTSVTWATIHLFLLNIIPAFLSSILLTGILYISFPIILILMVVIVLKDDSTETKELGNGEWGYADKDKDELWII